MMVATLYALYITETNHYVFSLKVNVLWMQFPRMEWWRALSRQGRRCYAGLKSLHILIALTKWSKCMYISSVEGVEPKKNVEFYEKPVGCRAGMFSVKSRLSVSFFFIKIGFLLHYYSITSCLSSLNISWENSLV